MNDHEIGALCGILPERPLHSLGILQFLCGIAVLALSAQPGRYVAAWRVAALVYVPRQ